jgi:hypothetical protein
MLININEAAFFHEGTAAWGAELAVNSDASG